MKNLFNYIIISCLLILISVGIVDAQQNLAQEAYAIFEQSCLICHGENGAYTEALIIEHTELIDDGKVLPGDPEGSIFYQRLIETDVAKRMPLGQPALDAESIETIRQWILAGAPDWDAVQRTNPSFITTDTMLETIENHVNTLTPQERSFARYFTLTHLYNAGETTEALNAYRRALSKLINSLSWGREVIKPLSIDIEETVYYVDLRDYEWDVRNDAWTQIEQVYPYKMSYDAPSQTHLHEKLTTLQQEMNCEVPFVHVDWFLATASLPPLYHDILALPTTDRELEDELKVFVAANLQNAPGERVWRAGFNDSGVSRHNRVVERHTSSYGAYWKSYDFAGSAESQNIFTHPLNFTHDGGEIIFNLPNGLQAYFLVDSNGNRLDVAPTDIVSNPAASDPAVRNGLSCIGCHTEGMKTFEDEVRAVVEQADNPPFNKARALDLYVEKTVMDDLVDEDTQRYREALEAAGGVFGGIEPIQRFHEAFQGPLSAAHAASAVGLETDVFLENISKNVSLQNLLGALVLENGAIKRDAWTSTFHDVIAALDSLDSILPPVVERPEIISGAGVYIPDVNLRAAIAEALGKAAGDEITVEDMESLTRFVANDKGIQDLTGVEFAINLTYFEIRRNLVSDISPLAGLTKLGNLRVQGNNISDISSITDLVDIGGLEIYDNEISDISPIAGLTNLYWLSMTNNPITDLSPLANLKRLNGIRFNVEDTTDFSPIAELTNLERFFLWGAGKPIPDLSPLANLPKLKHADIRGEGKPDLSLIARIDTLERFEFWGSGENLPDLSPLAESKNLKELWVINCGITDLTIIENFTGLERLNLERNSISDVSPLARLTNLKWLKLLDNPISDFSPLAEISKTTNIIAGRVDINDRNLRAAIADALGKEDTGVISITFDEMVTLTTLRASNRDIEDLTGLESATNLTEIRIGHNPISDLSPLASLTKLRQIWLHDTEVADLSPLASLINLEKIDVAHTRISNLAPLAGLKNLKKLDTIHSEISDLSPLAGLTNLTRLLLYDCKATDLYPLKDLTKLRWLGFPHTNNISDFSPLSGLTELRHLDLFHTEISNLTPLAGLVNLETLILNENRIVDVSPLASLPNLKRLELQVNNISDFSPLDRIRETIEVFNWYANPGFPQGGPKITGPWLWLTLPAEKGENVLLTDYLAIASNSKVTEEQIANLGASAGTIIGESVWSTGMLETYNANGLWSNVDNLERLLDPQESIEFRNDENFVVYGSIILYSPRTQQTKIFIGASHPRKVYHNSKLVHEDDANYSAGAWAYDYQTFFPITLQQGKNVFLVKLGQPWRIDLLSLFFGFEEDTEYTVAPPGVGISFSATETNLLAGDTLTLDLNAENITDLAGWQTDITFDPNVLEAVEVTEGDFLKSEGGNTFFQGGTIDNVTGNILTIFSTRISENGSSGTGALLSVTFKAKAAGETQVTLENFEFISITDDIIPTVHPNITITVGEYPAWDVNQDGRVSILDLILVARDFGAGTPANLRTDVNRDGVINIQDLIIVAQHMGETIDSAAPNLPAIGHEELTPAIVQAWIRQAQVEDDGSPAFRQGIENLQRLLASLFPEKTELLANYPNPFNPETWIPYHLSKPAEVTLTIYTINGSVIRTLALGHQAAGIYQSRRRAVYWNGRNDVGESVASGVYFYTLTAGDYTATRRMLILK
ncbi:MAG: leucine-rich repeat domain-containing protein [Candidatus Poribacteria bacterium]|nr:leucine-rich repeat domain-containing protein [Candidatus Poribacteria bacterium]